MIGAIHFRGPNGAIQILVKKASKGSATVLRFVNFRFEERSSNSFFSVSLEDQHFFVVCRYVERNALRTNLVKRAEDWRWGSLWRWPQKPEPEPRLLSSWPLPRLPGWTARVNESLTKRELDAVQLSAQRGKPMGDEAWVESIARRLNLESTMRPRGRPQVRFPKHPEENQDKYS